MRRIIAAMAMAIAGSATARPAPTTIDSAIATAMRETGAKGLAIAVIDRGQVRYVRAYGIRDAEGHLLANDTVMYGASLTKAVFAYTVMQLVGEGKLALDTPIATYLRKPLPDYPDDDRYSSWKGLASDPRWRTITPRMVLTHSTGFANFYFLEPDQTLHIHFDPGTRYGYSGDGMILLQFAIEQGLGLDLGKEMQRRVFDRFGMTRTSMMWRADFRPNLADGWDGGGKIEPHDERSKTRAAGSMDTTIADVARFAAAYLRGDGLSNASRREIVRGQLLITTATQFPSFQPELAPEQRRADLKAALGVVAFTGPQGPGWYKGGHNDTTGNTWVCLERGQRCVVLLANDVRAEAAFPRLVRLVLGETGVPYGWEYGDMKVLP